MAYKLQEVPILEAHKVKGGWDATYLLPEKITS